MDLKFIIKTLDLLLIFICVILVIDEVRMSEINVEIESIVKNLNKDIMFIQPVYEAIVNSLEANADTIDVEFFKDRQVSMDSSCDKISSYSVTDNGDGFTEENVNSFNKLWSTHKVTFGCKGSGRFTWLKIFNKISINSEIKKEGKKVHINFSKNYNKDNNTIEEDKNIKNNKTTVMFDDCVYPIVKGSKVIDERLPMDLETLYNLIFDYLLIKLFLLDKSGKNFYINIKFGEQIKTIQNKNIPNLKSKKFKIETKVPSDRYGDDIEFEIFYRFIKDKKKSKKANYCAHQRIVKTIDDDSLGFSASLPGGDSMIVLLCSPYFDDNVNDQRDGFSGLENSNMKARNTNFPILLTDIKAELKNQINDIIKEEYPNILEINKEIINIAINEAPYLSKMIHQNTDILVSKESLIKEAKNKFEKLKERAKLKFDELLKNAEVNVEALNASITEVSEVASAELGEYILYREKIIKALEMALSDEETKEKYIHKIFMPMNSVSTDSDKDKKVLSNLWLLDDKYMSYSFAASDKKIKDICYQIEEENKKRNIFMGDKKPDITILFNKEKK